MPTQLGMRVEKAKVGPTTFSYSLTIRYSKQTRMLALYTLYDTGFAPAGIRLP
jgi:hypothetical protein